MIFSLLAATALLLAFSNWANDNFKGFATVWGSASLSYRTAPVLFLLYARVLLSWGITLPMAILSAALAKQLVQLF